MPYEPRFVSPITSGRGDPWAYAANNALNYLAQGFSGPTQEEQRLLAAEQALRQAQLRKATLESDALQGAATARTAISEALRNAYGPESGAPEGFGELLARVPGLAANRPEVAGKLIQSYGQVFPGVDPDLATALSLAAGNAYGSTMQGEREAQANATARAYGVAGINNRGALERLQWEARNAPSLSVAQGEAFNALPPELQALVVGPTETQAKGGFLSKHFGALGDLPVSEREVLGANAGKVPSNWISRATGTQGRTFDGLTDATTGERLPGDAVTFGASLQGSGGETGLTTRTRQDEEAAVASASDFNVLANEALQLSQDATLFGTVGNARRGIQQLVAQLQAVGQAFDSVDARLVLDEMQQTAREEGRSLDPRIADDLAGLYDPSLDEINKLSTLLAYKAAASLAGQTGRGLSDRDYMVFKELIGDPTGWFASGRAFRAGVQKSQDMLNRMVTTRRKVLGLGPKTDLSVSTPTMRIRIDENGNLIE